MPMSPTKDGKMRKDKHWILKIIRDSGFNHPYRPHCIVHPVTSDECGFENWKGAHGIAAFMEKMGWHERWVGRRVNDEVELFAEEWGEEVSRFRLVKINCYGY